MIDIPNGRTANLRKFINDLFDDIGVENYNQSAPDNATMPYVVWELRELGSLIDGGNGANRLIFELNAYHMSDTLMLDNFLDYINELLEGETFNEDDFFVSFVPLYNRIDIDEGRELKRKRVQYEIKYFTGG